MQFECRFAHPPNKNSSDRDLHNLDGICDIAANHFAAELYSNERVASTPTTLPSRHYRAISDSVLLHHASESLGRRSNLLESREWPQKKLTGNMAIYRLTALAIQCTITAVHTTDKLSIVSGRS